MVPLSGLKPAVARVLNVESVKSVHAVCAKSMGILSGNIYTSSEMLVARKQFAHSGNDPDVRCPHRVME